MRPWTLATTAPIVENSSHPGKQSWAFEVLFTTLLNLAVMPALYLRLGPSSEQRLDAAQ
jgi:hypothetical protein